MGGEVAARLALLGGGLLLGACAAVPAVDTGLEARCDARELGADEVRARRIPCSDELVEGGDGRRSDWLLENSRLKVVVREEGVALTRFDLAGGTIVDLVPVANGAQGADDVLEEIVPAVGGRWFREVAISTEHAPGRAALVLSGTLEDGSAATVRYALEADSETLLLEGMDALTLVPGQGGVRVGDVVELDQELLWTTDGAVSDRGGWLDATGVSALTTGSREAVAAWRWPAGRTLSGSATLDDGTPVSGELPLVDAGATADVAWVAVLEGAEVVSRWPVDDGRFSAWVGPEATGLRLEVPGYEVDELGLEEGDTGGEQPEPALVAGAPGYVRVEVVDTDGLPLPARFAWGEAAWSMPAGGLLVPTGPGAEAATVSAGPAFSRWTSESLEVTGVTGLRVVLERTGAPRILAQLDREAWPDAGVRAWSEDVARDAAAEGVRFLVVVADDEVARSGLSSRDQPWLVVRAGSRADTDSAGRPLAWPWSRSNNRGGQGAAPWPDLSPLDLLAVMDDAGDRRTVVDPGWVGAAGDPLGWDPLPTALRVEDLGNLPVLGEVYDRFLPLVLVGPLTWIEGLDEEPVWSREDVEAMLLAGRTVAGNGPYISLEVDGVGPGGQAEVRPGGHRAREARVEVHAPAWMDLDAAWLLGSDGQEPCRWEASAHSGVRLRGRCLLPDDLDWVVAVAAGDRETEGVEGTPWAVTGPVWLGRP